MELEQLLVEILPCRNQLETLLRKKSVQSKMHKNDLCTTKEKQKQSVNGETGNIADYQKL